MRILVVDDDYTCRIKLKTMFAKYGDTDAAPNGDIALMLFEEALDEEGVMTVFGDLKPYEEEPYTKKNH